MATIDLKRLDIGSEGIVSNPNSIQLLYKGGDGLVEGYSIASETDGPAVQLGYETEGVPSFYIECTNDPGYAIDKYIYEGTFEFNGVIYDKGREGIIGNPPHIATYPGTEGLGERVDFFILTNRVVKGTYPAYPAQVESANCDGSCNDISDTYVKISAKPFTVSGSYSDLSGIKPKLYLHRVALYGRGNINYIVRASFINNASSESHSVDDVIGYFDHQPVIWESQEDNTDGSGIAYWLDDDFSLAILDGRGSKFNVTFSSVDSDVITEI